MNVKEVRPFVIEVLAQDQVEQFGSLYSKVNDLYLTKNNSSFSVEDMKYSRSNDRLKISMNIVNEIFWDLIYERVITLGLDESNLTYPWYRLTEYGRELLKKENFYLRDVDGYTESMSNLIKGIDPGVLQYMSEGFSCHRQGLLPASMVMLGTAGERLALILLESLYNSETDSGRQAKCKKLLESGTSNKILEHFNYRVVELATSGALPFSVHEGFSIQVFALLDIIRQHRNDSVHPRRGSFTRESVLMVLTSMPLLIEKVYRVKSWLDTNKLT